VHIAKNLQPNLTQVDPHIPTLGSQRELTCVVCTGSAPWGLRYFPHPHSAADPFCHRQRVSTSQGKKILVRHRRVIGPPARPIKRSRCPSRCTQTRSSPQPVYSSRST
jgi:hypothetical protein